MTPNSQQKKNQLNLHTESILESISDGVFTVDMNWTITFFNRAAEMITGISKNEAIGKRCSDVFRSSMCEVSCALKKTLRTGNPIINHPCYIINSQGKRIPISVSTAVLKNSTGKIIGGAETFRDLSEVEALRKELKSQYKTGDLISHSSSMRKVFDLIHTVAASKATVLIEGETGTGKELVAKAIHNLSARSKKPFIAINCGALPDSLLESELFGYKKGAFTGADRDKPGRFEIAKEGTLFLDEIGDITPALQIRLLRVLQEHCYEPLGSSKTEQTDTRIIAATHRNLLQQVKTQAFREDLYYRINVVRIELPPLRERKEDIPLLVEHFIQRFNSLYNRTIHGISPNTLSILMAHDWPGNVRELENLIERAFILTSGNLIELSSLPEEMTGMSSPAIPAMDMVSLNQLAEKQTILNALKRNHNNRNAAADELHIHKTTLFRKIKKLGITVPEEDGRTHPRKRNIQ